MAGWQVPPGSCMHVLPPATHGRTGTAWGVGVGSERSKLDRGSHAPWTGLAGLCSHAHSHVSKIQYSPLCRILDIEEVRDKYIII